MQQGRISTSKPRRGISPREVVYKARPAEMTQAEALAAKLEGKLAAVILEALKAQQDSIDLAALIRALESGNVAEVLALLDLPGTLAALDRIKGVIVTGATNAGAMTAAAISMRLRGAAFVFDQLNPRLIDWLQTYNLGLIRQINETTKEGIREFLVAGMQSGQNPKAVAVQVKNIIGLTNRQARAVYNFRKELETFHLRNTAGLWNLGGKISRVNGTQVLALGSDGLPKDGIMSRRLRDFRFDRQLKAAMSGGKPLTQEQIDKMVAAYYRKYLAYRSRTIARTEAIRTNNMGIADAWRQAADKGIANTQLTRKLWIVARDERLCEVCGPIPRMNPERGVKVDAAFKTPDGPISLPPAHPNCRCTVFYRQWEPEQLVGEENA